MANGAGSGAAGVHPGPPPPPRPRVFTTTTIACTARVGHMMHASSSASIASRAIRIYFTSAEFELSRLVEAAGRKRCAGHKSLPLYN